VKVHLRVTNWEDRRTLDLHARYDSIEEKRWRWRVERNAKEVSRLAPRRTAREIFAARCLRTG